MIRWERYTYQVESSNKYSEFKEKNRKMKVAIASTLILILTLLIWGYNFLTGYRSAFEADQACHYQIISTFENIKSLNCDHDLETRQWILYSKEYDNKPAEVIKRFKY